MRKISSEISVALIEDYETDITSIGSYIRKAEFIFDDSHVFRSYNDAQKVFTTKNKNKFDVALVDLSIPRAFNGEPNTEIGMELIDEFIFKYVNLKIIAIARNIEPYHMFRLIMNGVSLYC